MMVNNELADSGTAAQSDHKQRIGASFGKAATTYEGAAQVQQQIARRLAATLAALPLPTRPRILEIGCGTGFLTQALAWMMGPADWTVTDLSADMLAQAQTQIVLPDNSAIRYLVADGEHSQALAIDGGYDLICASLCTQWFENESEGLGRLAALLAPGGYLGIATLGSDTFFEWHQAHRECAVEPTAHRYLGARQLDQAMSQHAQLRGSVQRELVTTQYADGLSFVRNLKQIGAHPPVMDTVPLDTGAMRRVLNRFAENGACASYDVLYGLWQRQTSKSAGRGFFVTGTDTGIGKTLASAIITAALHASYWKPFQTGLADEPGDTKTVTQLANLTPERVIPPACELQASLSPEAAALLENATLHPGDIVLPAVDGQLVVEGAGGLFVPITADCMMIDLIAQCELPVILVARSALGTINHSLLSLQALRARGIDVAGVIFSGAPSASNRSAIERYGSVQTLLEIPQLETVDHAVVAELASQLRTRLRELS